MAPSIASGTTRWRTMKSRQELEEPARATCSGSASGSGTRPTAWASRSASTRPPRGRTRRLPRMSRRKELSKRITVARPRQPWPRGSAGRAALRRFPPSGSCPSAPARTARRRCRSQEDLQLAGQNDGQGAETSPCWISSSPGSSWSSRAIPAACRTCPRRAPGTAGSAAAPDRLVERLPSIAIDLMVPSWKLGRARLPRGSLDSATATRRVLQPQTTRIRFVGLRSLCSATATNPLVSEGLERRAPHLPLLPNARPHHTLCHPEREPEGIAEGSSPVVEDPFPRMRSGQALAPLVGMTDLWTRCVLRASASTGGRPETQNTDPFSFVTLVQSSRCHSRTPRSTLPL